MKISIIIPVYNSKKYLRKCLTSLKKQSYKNLEIILINDGSTDNSLDICNQYKKIDKRFKVYTKKNGGTSSARNYGIKKSTGDYITFVDNDDFINDNKCFEDYDYISHNHHFQKQHRLGSRLKNPDRW